MFMNNLSTLCIGIYVEKREFSKGGGRNTGDEERCRRLLKSADERDESKGVRCCSSHF